MNSVRAALGAVAVVFAIALVHGRASAADATPPLPPLEQSIVFDAPDGWKRLPVEPQRGTTRVIAEWGAPTAGLKAGDFWANINVAAQPFHGTVDEFVTGSTIFLYDPALHVTVISPPARKTLCNETPGYEVHVDRDLGTRVIHQDEMVIVTAGNAYIATYSFAGPREGGAAGDAALQTLCRAAYPVI